MFIQIDQCSFSSAETDFITEQAIFLLDDRSFLLGLVFSVVGFLLVLWLKEYHTEPQNLTISVLGFSYSVTDFFRVTDFSAAQWSIFSSRLSTVQNHGIGQFQRRIFPPCNWFCFQVADFSWSICFIDIYFIFATDFSMKLLIFLLSKWFF